MFEKIEYLFLLESMWGQQQSCNLRKRNVAFREGNVQGRGGREEGGGRVEQCREGGAGSVEDCELLPKSLGYRASRAEGILV